MSVHTHMQTITLTILISVVSYEGNKYLQKYDLTFDLRKCKSSQKIFIYAFWSTVKKSLNLSNHIYIPTEKS
jgi:hypothetical protein